LQVLFAPDHPVSTNSPASFQPRAFMKVLSSLSDEATDRQRPYCQRTERHCANRQSANCADSGLEPFDAIDIAAVLRNTA
jgi:hypothetical protein